MPTIIKKGTYIFLYVLTILMIGGCSILEKNDTIIDNTKITNTDESKEIKLPPVSGNETEKEFYANLSKKWIEEKHDPMEVITLYKKLITLFPPESEPRQTTLRYLLDLSLKYITEERKAKEALEIALELDKIIPYDFYIQNRIIGAYKIFAEDEMKKGELDKAMEWVTKGLQIRFDPYIMATKLDIEILMAKRAIKSGDTAEARVYLEEIINISDSQENKNIFSVQRNKAAEMLSELK